jgi:hypothetical protein
MTATAPIDSPDTASGVLDAVREVHSESTDLEIRKLQLAVDWAIMHPVESILHAAMVEGTEDELAIAGEGAPLVAEFCVAELALALGMSTGAGKRYLGDAVEIRYRLPRLWARVVAGEVPVWKARKIAARTIILPAEAAGFVDQHLAPTAHRCSYAQIDRAVDHARDLYDPEEAEANGPRPPSTAESRSDSATSPSTDRSTSRPPPTSPTPSPSKPRSQPKPTTSSRSSPTSPSTYAAPWPSAASATTAAAKSW